ncbi:MAG TPA: CHASE4 domain-containing protein [Lacunisphaera sp.]|jgi:signal transduction histidine kinase|nr:CHASE4 domain-containing protein [Lacunisphaera sp.]
MSIRLRLLLVLGLLLVAFAGALYQLRRAEQDHIARMVEGVRDDSRMQLAHWADLTGVSLRQFTSDFADWSETAAFLEKPDPAWAKAHLDESLPAYGLDAAWLLQADGRPAHVAVRNPAVPLPDLPPVADFAASAEARAFFADSPRGPWQVVAARVGGDRGGWLLAGRAWDEAQVAHLGQISDSRVTLLPVDAAPPAVSGRTVRFSRPLNDWKGRPLRLLAMEQDLPAELTSSIEWDGYVIRLFIGFGALLVLALGLSVRSWVLQPLRAVGDSLARQDPAPIAPLLERRDEFQHVARLVESSFAARRALEHEVSERKHAEDALRASEEQVRHSMSLRARLARDLHDSVIQALYASGLGLEAARTQMSKNPFGAEGRISDCIVSLNETIRLVRNYINDIEPFPNQDYQTFGAAVRALARTMHALAPVEIDVRIADAAAARLTPAVEVQLLQIVREGISNAMRHGAATRITVTLRDEAEGAVLEVTDNGRGFDPAQRAGTGRGLINLGERAAEIRAALQLQSAPGQGTRLSLRLPPSGKEPA